MKKISTIVFMVAFTIVALTIFYFPDQSNSSKTIKSSGTIGYSQTAVTPQEPSSFSLYSTIKEITQFIFGGIGAVSGIIKILEYMKKHIGQKMQILNINRYS